MISLLVFGAAVLLQDPAFVPALQHETRTVPQWIEELAHGSRLLDALWSLCYTDNHSPQVIAALKDALADSRPAECRMAADSILCQWRVPHELLPAEVYSGGVKLAEYANGFGLPLAPMEGNPTEREAALRSNDDDVRVSAAIGMLLQHELAPLALRELLESSRASDWACAYAGSAWFDALGERLAGSESVQAEMQKHADWPKRLASRASGRTAALPWLAKIGAAGKEAAQVVQPLITALLDWSVEDTRTMFAPYMWLNERSMDSRTDPDPFLEDCYVKEAQRVLAGSDATRADMLRLHAMALRYPRVAGMCRERLPDWLDRVDGVGAEALCILAHIATTDPKTRTAYLNTIRAWSSLHYEGLAAVPCWKQHDQDTRTAFLQLLERAVEPYGLHDQVRFAGELDAATSEIARSYLERTKGATAWLVSEGFRGAVVVDKSLSLAQQVNQIALNIATKQANGQDFVDDERQLVAILELPYTKGGAGGYDDQVQWGLFHAQTLGLRSRAMVHVALHFVEIGDTMVGFGTHSDAAIPYLESIPLEVEDHLALRKLRPPDQPEPEWRGINIANERYGGEPVSKLSLEDVPRWRHKLFAGEPRYLEKLMRVTPLTEREVPYLTLVLERGTVDQRLWALDLVEEFKVDAAKVQACVARLADVDLDISVRRTASRLCAHPARPR